MPTTGTVRHSASTGRDVELQKVGGTCVMQNAIAITHDDTGRPLSFSNAVGNQTPANPSNGSALILCLITTRTITVSRRSDDAHIYDCIRRTLPMNE
jgi:hypothetical protein